MNAGRSELRQAFRISVGIGEATSNINSIELLNALVLDPLEAQAQHERQKAEAKINEQRQLQQGAPN